MPEIPTTTLTLGKAHRTEVIYERYRTRLDVTPIFATEVWNEGVDE